MHAKFILDESRQAKLSPAAVEFYNFVSNYQVTAEDIQSKKSEFQDNVNMIGKKRWWIILIGFVLFIAFIGTGLWAMVGVISEKASENSQTIFMFVTGAGILCAFVFAGAEKELEKNYAGIFTLSEIEEDENLCAKAVEYCEKSELANEWRLNVLATRGKLFIGDVAIMERLYFKDKSEKTRSEILKRTNEISEKLHSTAPAQ